MTTFLFTDIENSTLKWQNHPEGMSVSLAIHDRIIRRCVESHGGQVVKHTGDGFLAAFHNGEALICAAAVQRDIKARDWEETGGLRVRIGVHPGEAEARNGDFFGPSVNRAARITASGAGGQIVFSEEALRSERIPGELDARHHGRHMLTDLLEPIGLYTLFWSGDPEADHLPLKTVTTSPGSLPRQNTPFIGRADHIKSLTGMIRSDPCRMLTIQAPGGGGKTRLALQVAAEVMGHFPEGVFFVSMEDASGDEEFTARISGRLGISLQGPGGGFGQLLDGLRDRRCLLVLDNMEHLLPSRPLIGEILSGAPGVKILATSRHRLGLAEEHLCILPGLTLPGENGLDFESADSCALFLETAGRVSPGYTPDGKDRESIRELCRLLEGSPLGIELAASWMRLLPAASVLKEIEEDFSLLKKDDPSSPERHRSLRLAFDYSLRLLSEKDREALAGVSVFRGSFTPEAFRAVTGGGLQELASLHDKSLLKRSGRDRFRLHGILRSFALEIQEDHREGPGGLADRHCVHYGERCGALLPLLKSGEQLPALDETEADLENLRAGFLHALSHRNWRTVSRYASLLALFYQMRSRFIEGRVLFDQGLETLESREWHSPQAPPDRRNCVSLTASSGAMFHVITGNLDRGGELAEQARALSLGTEDPRGTARSLNILGIISFNRGGHEEAARLLELALEHGEETTDAWVQSSMLSNLGTVSRALGQRGRARKHLERALSLARETGDRFRIAQVLVNLGSVSERLRAMEMFTEALEIRKQLGDKKGIAFLHFSLGAMAVEEDPVEAERHWSEALAIQEEVGDRPGMVRTLHSLGDIEARKGNLEPASGLFRRSLELAGRIGALEAMNESRRRMALIRALTEGGGAGLDLMDRNLEEPCFRNSPLTRGAHHGVAALCAWMAGDPDRAGAEAVSALEARGEDPGWAALLSSALLCRDRKNRRMLRGCLALLNPGEIPVEIRKLVPEGPGEKPGNPGDFLRELRGFLRRDQDGSRC